MHSAARVLWGEGLFLRPQHFQQQDCYHEARLHQTASALHPYAWGVQQLVIDDDALQSEVLRVTALAVVFPDGEAVQAPQADVLPLPVRLSELAPSVQSVTYHLALPTLRQHGENCGDAARYSAHERDTQDLFTDAADAPVTFLRKSLRLVADTEPLDAYDSLPLVRLRRLPTGGFAADPAFLPPCLRIAAAPALTQQLARLMEKLLAKVNALYGQLREPSPDVVEIRGGDMSAFWLLHTASTGYAALSHYLSHAALHPERLYAALLSLAGGLLTYSRTHRLEDLPAYDHANPGPGFARLDEIIRHLLDTVVSSRYVTIHLRQARPSYHLGTLDAGRIGAQTALYLAVSADLPALQLVEVVPLRFKVGAPEDVDRCVLSAMPGVRLMHAAQVPPAIPVRPNTCYFALDHRGPLYDNMLRAQAISVYVPNGLRDLQLDLIAIVP